MLHAISLVLTCVLHDQLAGDFTSLHFGCYSALSYLQAQFGEKLKVVGSSQELGEWNVFEAPDMRWTDGHLWVADLQVPEVRLDLSLQRCHMML